MSARRTRVFSRDFKRGGNKLIAMKARYAKAETNVDQICDALEAHQVQLLKDISVLDKMYEVNKTYFKELSMYLLAGNKKLDTARMRPICRLCSRKRRLPACRRTRRRRTIFPICAIALKRSCTTWT